MKMHVLVLAAQHPDLTISSEAQQFVADFQPYDPADWAEMQTPHLQGNRRLGRPDAECGRSRELQSEMDSLATEYSKLMASSIAEQFAFIPAHPRPIAYLSSTFLHGGWIHLIGNMWFLWLAGFVLGRRMGPSTLSGLLSHGGNCRHAI